MSSITKSPNQASELITIQSVPLDQNPAAVYLASLSKGSRGTMHQALDVIAEFLTGTPDAFSCNWAGLRIQHTQAIRTMLAERYAYSSANKMLSALRMTLEAAWLLKQMSAEDYHRARHVGSVKGTSLPAGRHLPGGEISGLMGVCENDTTPAGARDAAIIAMLYVCGLRRAEIAAIDLDDFNNDEGSLKILGKGNKERTAYLVNGALHALRDWLHLRGDEPGALFMAINKGGKIRPGRMTTQAVYNMLIKRGKQAGIKDFSPHDFRRTFVGDLLDAGADIAIVAKMAGHASVTTTARYDRRPEAAKQKAANLLHVPYRGRLT